MSGERIRLEVKERGADGTGSRNVGRLRRQGLIPGVLYGNGHARAIAVEERRLRAALTGPSGLHAILDVVLEGQKTAHHAVLKDYQRHAIRGTLTHVDFHEVRLDQAIQAAVVVQFMGESQGVKEGGVLSQVTREVNVEALPMEIPEHIEVDISGMQIGDTLRLSDVRPIEGVRFLDDPEETVLANVAAPRLQAELDALEEEAAAAAAEAVEAPKASPRRPPPRARSRRRASPPNPPRSRPWASSAGATVPRRSTCWWSGSATPVESTSPTGTTSAGWSSTSWRVVTAAPSRASSAAGSRSCASVSARVALLKPETFMNDSGRSLGAAARFFKTEPEHVVVVHDDVDLETARLQARAGGGLAGHNGLRSVAGRARLAGLPAAADRRRPPRPRRPAAGGGLRALARSSRRTTPRRSSRGRPTRSRRSSPRGSRRPSAASTEALGMGAGYDRPRGTPFPTDAWTELR